MSAAACARGLGQSSALDSEPDSIPKSGFSVMKDLQLMMAPRSLQRLKNRGVSPAARTRPNSFLGHATTYNRDAWRVQGSLPIISEEQSIADLNILPNLLLLGHSDDEMASMRKVCVPSQPVIGALNLWFCSVPRPRPTLR